MRIVYFILIALLFSLTCLAKGDTTLKQFLNYDKKPDEKNLNPFYYRIAVKKSRAWHVKDYYVKEKSLAMEGTYSDEAFTVPHGTFYWFHTNKTLERKGRYLFGKKDGLWKAYFPNGTLCDSTYYREDIPIFLSITYDSAGLLRKKGMYDKEGRGTGYEWEYYSDGTLSSFGKYSDGYKKDSVWHYIDENGIVSMVEAYDKGRRELRRCYDVEGNLQQGECDSVKLPEFEGNINLFLATNLRYPDEMKSYGVQCQVVSRFIVRKNGSISDIEIVTDTYPAANEEVIRVLRKMPPWKPAQLHNRTVPIYFTLPIRFALE